MLPEQLTLNVINAPAPSFENFIGNCNAEVTYALQQALEGNGPSFIHIWGEQGCGKTHLLRAIKANANLPEQGLIPQFSLGQHIYIVDDVDQLPTTAHQDLFILQNQIRENNGYRLVTSSEKAPLQLGIRDDIRTRLGWGIVYRVTSLSDEEKEHALNEQIRARGVNCSSDLVPYLLTHWPRDLSTLIGVIAALDAYALKTKRAWSIPLLKEMLAQG